MSPVIRRRSCAKCGAPVPPDACCAICGQAHGEARRKQRHREHGYGTRTWARLRTAAIAAHPWCEDCGATTDLTGGHRRYPARTLADVTVQCRTCNSKDARGTLEGGRAHG